MSKGADRFAEPLQKDPFYYDQPLNEFTSDVNMALAATKPESKGVNFGKQSAGTKNMDLNQLMQVENKKNQKM